MRQILLTNCNNTQRKDIIFTPKNSKLHHFFCDATYIFAGYVPIVFRPYVKTVLRTTYRPLWYRNDR